MKAMVVHNAALDWSDIGDCQRLSGQLFRAGFASINHITTIEDINLIRAELLDLLDDHSGKKYEICNLGDAVSDPRDGSILEVVSPSTVRPRLLESLFFQRALHVSRAIIGASARLRFDHFISKPPHNAGETDWHQDSAYRRLTRSPRRLHWWLPLQDVSTDNGCMQFVERSHLGPVQPHTPRQVGAHALKTELPTNAIPIACPLTVGGATIHLPKTLHCTGANNSDLARHAWVVQIGIPTWIPTFLR